MEPMDKITQLINELALPPDKAIELKTQVMLLSISQYQKGAETALKIFKNLNSEEP